MNYYTAHSSTHHNNDNLLTMTLGNVHWRPTYHLGQSDKDDLITLGFKVACEADTEIRGQTSLHFSDINKQISGNPLSSSYAASYKDGHTKSLHTPQNHPTSILSQGRSINFMNSWCVTDIAGAVKGAIRADGHIGGWEWGGLTCAWWDVTWLYLIYRFDFCHHLLYILTTFVKIISIK